MIMKNLNQKIMKNIVKNYPIKPPSKKEIRKRQ